MNIKINLLAPDKKEEIKTVELFSVVGQVSMLILLAMIILITFLFACLHLVSLQSSALQEDIQRLTQSPQYREFLILKRKVYGYKTNIDKIYTNFNNRKNNFQVLDIVNKAIVEGITLKEIAIKETSLSISGMAEERGQLIDFKNNLEKNERFSNLESPISNLVANENANFLFKLDFK